MNSVLRMSPEAYAAHQARLDGAKAKVRELVANDDLITPAGTGGMVATGRPRDKGMNKTEAAYDALLADRFARGEVLWYRYEGITLKLADDTRYTPDFAVMLASGELEMHETKGGFIREDAWVKLKVAAGMFPLRFWKCVQRTKKAGGGFVVTEV